MRKFTSWVLCLVLFGGVMVGCSGGVPAQHRLGDDVTFQPDTPGEVELANMTKEEAQALIPTHGPEIMEVWAGAQRGKATRGQ